MAYAGVLRWYSLTLSPNPHMRARIGCCSITKLPQISFTAHFQERRPTTYWNVRSPFLPMYPCNGLLYECWVWMGAMRIIELRPAISADEAGTGLLNSEWVVVERVGGTGYGLSRRGCML